MAEAASTLIALIVFAFDASKSLYEALSRFKSQRQTIKDVLADLATLTTVLTTIREQAQHSQEVESLETLRKPLNCCAATCQEMREMLDTCTTHLKDGPASVRDLLRMRYREKNFDDMRNRLASYKSTLVIAFQSMDIQDHFVTQDSLEDLENLIGGTREDLEDQLDEVRQAISAADASLRESLQDDQARLLSSLDNIAQSQRVTDMTRPKVIIEGNKGDQGARATFETDALRFLHEPLDRTEGSIRLLRILPQLSRTGLIQCEIWHDSILATYTCLSYMWGSEYDQQCIQLNGKVFRVRRNLWDFLSMARTSAASAVMYWIDAICIQQDDIEERNQQVTQMGRIYTSATEVMAWLGFNESLLIFFAFMHHMSSTKQTSKKDARTFWHREQNKKIRESWLAFWANPYWMRAWITQELLLAKSLRLRAGELDIGLAELKALGLLFPLLNKTLSKVWRESDMENRADTAYLFDFYVNTMVSSKRGAMGGELKEEARDNLVTLLNSLRGRQCQIPRDRVYSLLSIAYDGAGVIVDYGSPDDQVLLDVIKAVSGSICLCSITQLAAPLRISNFGGGKTDTSEFALTLFKISLTNTYIGPNKSSNRYIWGYDDRDEVDHCGECGNQIVTLPAEELVFCFATECAMRFGIHMIIHKDAADKREPVVARVTARNADSREVIVQHLQTAIPEHPENNDDDDGEQVGHKYFNIYLKPDSLLHMVQYGADVRDEICSRSKEGESNFTILETFNQSAEQMWSRRSESRDRICSLQVTLVNMHSKVVFK